MGRDKHKLNPKESRVLDALTKASPKSLTIGKLADTCFSNACLGKNRSRISVATRNSWVRNSLRKLRRLGLVEASAGLGEGEYRSVAGRA